MKEAILFGTLKYIDALINSDKGKSNPLSREGKEKRNDACSFLFLLPHRCRDT